MKKHLKISDSLKTIDQSVNPQIFSTQRLHYLKKRSSLEVAGALLFICLLSVIGGTVKANEDQQNITNQHTANTALDNQSSNTAATPASPTSPALTSEPVSSTASNSDMSAAGNVTSHISTSTVNGVSSTQVSVNGQQIPVPSSGGTYQTIVTPNGTATVSSSSNQVSAGSASNSSSSNLSVSISN